MKFISVCSGIEAASVAWKPLGWEAVAFSEIEPFPCAVLAHHYPTVPNYGDMTKFEDWPDHAIDLLCGGTPCQSFSVAGLRKGLDDPRGNLMLTFGAIAAKYRPQWLVWENVPGVLSSNGGWDFGSFLGMLGQLGYGFAYRVLDAQYFGVAQRRRRVFVVGCLGDWRSAAAVLFERHSLQGHFAPRREAGKGTAHATAPCLTSSGRGVERTGDTRGQDPVVAVMAPTAFGGNNTSGHIDVATALNACASASGRMDFESETFLVQQTAMQVRRITPVECERLQGFPDNYTRIPTWSGWRKLDDSETPEQCIEDGLEVKQSKKTGKWRVKDVDGPRYKALGNSWAVPNVRWIGERIEQMAAVRKAIQEAA
jgi:DNA-cytosine methyltransferase